MIAYGFVIVATARLAGPTRSATDVRKALAPTLRDSPAVAYGTVGGALFLLVLIGPTPAFRSVVWVLVFAVLVAFGVTMPRRQTALEFPEAQHGHPLRDFRDRRAAAHAYRAAPQAKPNVSDAAPATNGGRVDMLERLAALRDRGAITNQEYQAEKTLVMSNGR
jgi:hypothetical protein